MSVEQLLQTDSKTYATQSSLYIDNNDKNNVKNNDVNSSNDYNNNNNDNNNSYF